MTNQQYEEVEDLIRKGPRKVNQCPTCLSIAKEDTGGVEWPESQFRLRQTYYPCNCEEQYNLYRHYLLANIPDEYMRFNQKDYIGDEQAWREMDEYLANWDNFKAHGIGVGFYSKRMGTGKTFLATFLGRELIKKKERVYFVNFRDIIPLFNEPYEARIKVEERLKYDTVLILDEVSRAITAAQRGLFAEKLEGLIRNRTNHGRVTILTTNFEPESLNEEYERVFSLLSEREKSIIVKTAVDVRGELKNVNVNLALKGEQRPIS